MPVSYTHLAALEAELPHYRELQEKQASLAELETQLSALETQAALKTGEHEKLDAELTAWEAEGAHLSAAAAGKERLLREQAQAEAVSYTHLDVYKRQALGARIDKIQQPSRDQIVLLLPRGMRLLINAGTDVYKRQSP